jgi:glucose-6-phosphate 1-dehydrogenase
MLEILARDCCNVDQFCRMTSFLNLRAQVKRPGPQMLPMPVELSVVKKHTIEQESPYQRLLTNALHGD